MRFQDGNLLEESPRWKFIEEEDNYTLLIYEVQPEDAGLYDCVALNNVGKATCTAKLNIESKLIFGPLIRYSELFVCKYLTILWTTELLSMKLVRSVFE